MYTPQSHLWLFLLEFSNPFFFFSGLYTLSFLPLSLIHIHSFPCFSHYPAMLYSLLYIRDGICVFFEITIAWNWVDTLQFGGSVTRGMRKTIGVQTAFLNHYVYGVNVSDLLLPSPNMTLLKRWQNIWIMQPPSSLLWNCHVPPSTSLSLCLSVIHGQASSVCLSALTNTKLTPPNALMLCACAPHPRCPIFSHLQLHCNMRNNTKLHLSPTCVPWGPVKHG